MAEPQEKIRTGTEEDQQLALWRCVCLFSGYPFRISGRGTRAGAKFKYIVSKAPGNSGRKYEGENVEGFGNELWIIQNGEKKEKSISRSSVDYAFSIVQEKGVASVTGPKQLKVYGSSYVYSVFRRFGLV